ncbi:MAG TPA: lipid-binding SYLF domain-containing protein [Geminicoccaceae bacterium]|nr:lipid-binding SYLF domain-containing protein [Geminicoccaceae bacterium]
MARAIRSLAFVLVGLLASGPIGAHAQASGGQQRVVDRARLAVESFIDDPNLQEMRNYVQNAYGVLVIPELLTGGLIVGANFGIGVLLSRDVATGDWSAPAFYALYGGSFGLQFGGKTSDAVYTIMNEAAVLKLMSARVKLGADASIAVGRVGAGVGAGTTASFGEDVYVFSKSKGLFGGLAIDGAVVVPRDDWNAAYYGRAVSPEEILRARHVASPGADALREALRRLERRPATPPPVADAASAAATLLAAEDHPPAAAAPEARAPTAAAARAPINVVPLGD